MQYTWDHYGAFDMIAGCGTKKENKRLSLFVLAMKFTLQMSEIASLGGICDYSVRGLPLSSLLKIVLHGNTN